MCTIISAPAKRAKSQGRNWWILAKITQWIRTAISYGTIDAAMVKTHARYELSLRVSKAMHMLF